MAPPSLKAALASSRAELVEFSERNAPRPEYFDGTETADREEGEVKVRAAGREVARMAEVRGIRLIEVRSADMIRRLFYKTV